MGKSFDRPQRPDLNDGLRECSSTHKWFKLLLILLYGFSERILRFQIFICYPPFFPAGSFIRIRENLLHPLWGRIEFFFKFKHFIQEQKLRFLRFQFWMKNTPFFPAVLLSTRREVFKHSRLGPTDFSTLFLFNERKI